MKILAFCTSSRKLLKQYVWPLSLYLAKWVSFNDVFKCLKEIKIQRSFAWSIFRHFQRQIEIFNLIDEWNLVSLKYAVTRILAL